MRSEKYNIWEYFQRSTKIDTFACSLSTSVTIWWHWCETLVYRYVRYTSTQPWNIAMFETWGLNPGISQCSRHENSTMVYRNVRDPRTRPCCSTMIYRNVRDPGTQLWCIMWVNHGISQCSKLVNLMCTMHEHSDNHVLIIMMISDLLWYLLWTFWEYQLSFTLLDQS